MKKLLMALVVFGCMVAQATFEKEAEITLAYAGDETLLNFPVLVRLPTRITSLCRADGADLRFYDGGTELVHEYERWSQSDTSLAWVKVPELTKGKILTVRFADTAVTTLPNRASVWSAYAVVIHGGDAITNAVENTILAWAGYEDCVADNTTGRIGGGISKTRCDTYGVILNDPKTVLADTGKYSVSGWFNLTNATSAILGASLANVYWPQKGGFIWQRCSTDDSYVTLFAYENSNQFASNKGAGLPDNTWGHLAFTYDKSSKVLKKYKDGALDKTKTSCSDLVMSESGKIWAFGSRGYQVYNQGISGIDNRYKDSCVGTMDELRVYDGVASAAWLKAEYDTAVDESYASIGPVKVPEVIYASGVESGDKVFITGECAGADAVSIEYWTDPTAKLSQACTLDGNVFRCALDVLPNTNYTYRALITSGAAVSTWSEKTFTTLGPATVASAVTASSVQLMMSASGTISALGAGRNTATLLVGTSAENLVAIGEPMPLTSIGSFSVSGKLPAYDKYYYQIMVVNSCTNTSTASWTNYTAVSSSAYTPTDANVYVWTGNGGDGNWSTTANWSLEGAADDPIGYPDFGATVKFEQTGAKAEVSVDGNYSVGTLESYKAGVNTRICGTSKSATTLTVMSLVLNGEGCGATNELEKLTLSAGSSTTVVGADSLFVMRAVKASFSRLDLSGVAECYNSDVSSWVVMTYNTNPRLTLSDTKFYGQSCWMSGGTILIEGRSSQLKSDYWYANSEKAPEHVIEFRIPVGGYSAVPFYCYKWDGSMVLGGDANRGTIRFNVLADSPAANVKGTNQYNLVSCNGGILTDLMTLGSIPHAKLGSAFEYTDIKSGTDMPTNLKATLVWRPGIVLVFR